MTFPSLRPSRFQIVSAALVIFSLLSGVHSLHIDTPQAVSECETTKLTWEGSHSPFTLHIRSYPNNSLVSEFNTSSNSVFWQAAVPAGTVLYLELLDSNSADNSPSFSGDFHILPGDNACLQSSTNSSSTNTAATTTPSYTSTGTSSSTSSSSTVHSSDAGAGANPPERKPTNTLSTGTIAGIAVACLAAGLLIALGIWLIRRRRKSSKARSPRIPDRQQFDTYDYPKSPKSDDGWSVTTPRDYDEELRSQSPGRDKADPSWDRSLFVREKSTPSPSLPTDHPVVTRQAIHPGTALSRPLSSYPPLIPIPTPSPVPTTTPARESGMWADSSSGASLSRSSTNPFRARMLAAAAHSGTGYAPQAGVNGSNWGEVW